MTAETGVTVVVPTLSRGEVLLDALRDLLCQEHRPLEILVVDQSDQLDPGLKELVEQNAEILSLYTVSFRGLPAARNFGWRHARYEAIVYVDDDIRCGSQLVSEHLRALQMAGVGVVAGGIEEKYARPETRACRTGYFNRWTADPQRGFVTQGEGEVDHAAGGNFSAWKKVLAEIGGVDEKFQIGATLYEETDFCLRAKDAGYRVYFNGAASLVHLAAGSGGCRVRDMVRYIYGLAHNRLIVMRRHVAWYQWPSAVLRLVWIVLAYAFHYRDVRILASACRGAQLGWREALAS